MKHIALPVFLVAAGNIWGQAGANLTALGGNTANPDAAFSLTNNPAHFVNNKAELGVWGTNRFTGTNLVNGGFAFHAVHAHSAIGFSADYSGSPLFHKTGFYLHGGQKFKDNFSCGFSIGYRHLFQANEYRGIRGRVTGKLATHFAFTKKADAALVISNPWMVKDEWSLAPSSIHLSLGYLVATGSKVYAQFKQQNESSAIFGLALVHKFREQFEFRAALQNGYEPLSIGISWKQKNLSLSLASAYHTYLGFSPAFSLLWQKS